MMSLIPPKCVYRFFHSSKMCIPFLFFLYFFLQNVHMMSLIPPKCAFQVFYSSKMYIQVLSLIQNVKLNSGKLHMIMNTLFTTVVCINKVHTSSSLPPKCAYLFFHFPKMCIPVLSLLQNLHTSSFI